VILGGGVCLLLSAHRAVIFAIAQLSCFSGPPYIHGCIVDYWRVCAWNVRLN